MSALEFGNALSGIPHSPSDTTGTNLNHFFLNYLIYSDQLSGFTLPQNVVRLTFRRSLILDFLWISINSSRLLITKHNDW